MRRLIVNADGFGFTSGVNRGITEAVQNGIVTSVSCTANFAAIEELPDFVRRFPQVSVGIHFNLSVGRPLLPPSEVPTLVDPQGELWGRRFVGRVMSGRIRMADMERELDAQVRRMRDLGAELTHWDGHQNKHLYPSFFLAAARVARAHGITCLRCHRRWLLLQDGSARRRRIVAYYLRNPKRLLTHTAARVMMRIARLQGFRMADRLVSPAYLDHSAKYLTETWIAILRQLPPGTSEIYCHPGYPDDTLRAHAVYVDQRRQEVAVLTSPELRDAVAANGIELISFHDL